MAHSPDYEPDIDAAGEPLSLEAAKVIIERQKTTIENLEKDHITAVNDWARVVGECIELKMQLGQVRGELARLRREADQLRLQQWNPRP